MNNHRILIIGGILPALLSRNFAETGLVELKHGVSVISPIQIAEISAIESSERHQESWQEKPNRRAGFAAARRQAKKNRRR